MAKKKLIYLFFVFSCLPIASTYAENFLLPQPDAHRSTVPQVKQKIGEILSRILYAGNKNIQLRSQLQVKLLSLPGSGLLAQECVKELAKAVELQAQVNYEIYNRIQELVDNNKNAFLNRAYKQELLLCLKELEKIYQQQAAEQQELLKQQPHTIKLGDQAVLEQLKKRQHFDQQEITHSLNFIKNGCAVCIKKQLN